MNQKLVLENAGDEGTMTVSECRTVQTKFGTKLVFVGTDDEGTPVETPLIPDTTGMKQLERLGLTTETCVGESLRFSRANNPSGKPYWNIDVAGHAPAPSKRMAPPAAVKAEVVGKPAAKPVGKSVNAIAEAYGQLWETMAGYLSVSCATHQVALTADAVQAATATVWIALRDHGLQGVAVTPTAPAAPAEPAPAIKHPAPTGKRLAPPAAKEPDFSKFPPPNAADDDLPF